MLHKKHRPKRRLPRWAHQSVYAGVRAGVLGLNLAGPEPSMRFMRGAAGAYATLWFNRARLARAEQNLSWCFPSWDAATVREYAVESYRHLFCLASEVALAPRLLSEDGYATHVEVGAMGPGLEALRHGKPCVFITGHAGNWELLGYTLAALGFPMHALYRPFDMAPLDRWVHQTRSRRGLTLVDKFGAAERLPAILESGLPVGFIADQNAGDRGLYVPFFNRLASTYKTIGLLAMRYSAPVVCGHAMRLSGMGSNGAAGPSSEVSRASRNAGLFRYRIDVVDVIKPEDWEGRPDPLFYITARYRRAIETMVRRAPEQYLWMHRYWKSRPRHEREGRPFPAQLREKIASLPWMDEEDVRAVEERSARDAEEIRRRSS